MEGQGKSLSLAPEVGKGEATDIGIEGGGKSWCWLLSLGSVPRGLLSVHPRYL